MPVDAATRPPCSTGSGMFGIRIRIWRCGRVSPGSTVAPGRRPAGAQRVDRPGRRHRQHFAQRSDLLKSHTALVALRRLVEDNPTTPRILADIEPVVADTHAFEGTAVCSANCVAPNDVERRRNGVVAPDRRRFRNTDAARLPALGTRRGGPRPGVFAAAQRWRRRARSPGSTTRSPAGPPRHRAVPNSGSPVHLVGSNRRRQLHQRRTPGRGLEASATAAWWWFW